MIKRFYDVNINKEIIRCSARALFLRLIISRVIKTNGFFRIFENTYN